MQIGSVSSRFCTNQRHSSTGSGNSATGTANLMPNTGERTGLTPQYSGPDLTMGIQGMNGPTSPFSQLFGAGSTAFQGLDVPSGNIDWVRLLCSLCKLNHLTMLSGCLGFLYTRLNN